MSLYNMMFGQNPASDVLLAVLGLGRGDVGRFRDCFVADDKIAVYTRNGGGNRDCWHEDSPEWGSVTCRHEAYEAEEDEWEPYTGRKVKAVRYRCLEPNSEHCGCVGCFMTYRAHKLPHYHHDKDDDFDETYCTIYFSFPPEFADDLRALDSGEPWNPSERWQAAIDALKPEAAHA